MRPAAGGQAQQVLQPGQQASLVRLEVEEAGQPWDYRYATSWSRGDYRAEHDDAYLYSPPYRPGPGFLVTQSYDGDFSHQGDSRYAVDFEMPEGTPILAAREGRVVGIRADSTVGGPSREYDAAANYVIVQHADGTFAEYLHLQPDGVRVRVGEQVRRGQLLGLSGNTGFSSGPHLHFMVSAATKGAGRRSVPIRFRTGDGIVAVLEVGQHYSHAEQPAQPTGVDAIAVTEPPPFDAELGLERPADSRSELAVPAAGDGAADRPS